MMIKYMDFDVKRICDYCGCDFLLKYTNECVRLIAIKFGNTPVKREENIVYSLNYGKNDVTFCIDGKKLYTPLLFYSENSYDVENDRIDVCDDSDKVIHYSICEFIKTKTEYCLHSIYANILSYTSFSFRSRGGNHSYGLECKFRECIADYIIKAIKEDIHNYIKKITENYVKDKRQEYEESIENKRNLKKSIFN